MVILLDDLFNKSWIGRPLWCFKTNCLLFDDAIRIIFFDFKISFKERLLLEKLRCSSSNKITLFCEFNALDVFTQLGKIDAKWPSSPIPNMAIS